MAQFHFSPAGFLAHTWFPSSSFSRVLAALNFFNVVYRKLPLWSPAVMAGLAKGDFLLGSKIKATSCLESLDHKGGGVPLGSGPVVHIQSCFPGKRIGTYLPSVLDFKGQRAASIITGRISTKAHPTIGFFSVN